MSHRSRSPFSEGEIVSGDEEKAIRTSTHPPTDGKVNPSTRHPSAGFSSQSAQPNRMGGFGGGQGHHGRGGGSRGRNSQMERDKSRSRSPYRAGKPTNREKRPHDDDHYNSKAASDPRRFKVHYESERSSHDTSYRSRPPYSDRDRPPEAKDSMSYDDRSDNRGRETQRVERNRESDRDRSRSPFRHDKAAAPKSAANGSAKDANSATALNNRQSNANMSRGQDDAKVKLSLAQHTNAGRSGADNESGGDSDVNGMGEQTAEPQKQLTEAELIEQRRKRREAIKARHRTSQPLLVQALEQNLASAPATPLHDSSGAPSELQSPPSSANSPSTPHKDSPPGSPAAFAVNNDEELVDRRRTEQSPEGDEGPSAADYDPNLDMQEDRPDHKRQDMQADEVETAQKDVAQVAEPKKEFDMFADDDDDDDMFAPVDSTSKAASSTIKQAKTLDQSLLDNWDYPDGHYRIILGELLDGRYAVQQQIGKGTFATVVRAQDSRTGASVAVKIACNNETMYKAGQKEMDMLQLLNQNDPDDKKHIIRLLRQFEHKGHLCLVFENLSADLREVLKKFGRNLGLNLKAIRSYAQQMFLALSHLKKYHVLHADLKPDNILVSEKRSVLKVCDLGTASFADDAEITPYLVSRFYRAPEVILGVPFDYAIDMWSIGCTLFELYTGRILFAGSDNNQMLRAIQECRGKFPMRMLKRSTLADKHFDIDGNFFSQERDKITGKATMRQLNFFKTAPGKDLKARLSTNLKGMRPEEIREHAAFVDLMDKCLQLDPARRISPNEALRHGFVAHGGEGKQQQQQEKEKPAVKVAMNVPRMR